MKLIGALLLVLIIVLYLVWLHWMLNKKGAKAEYEKGKQTFNVTVQGAYTPDKLEAVSGKDIIIRFNRKESSGCSKIVKFPDLGIREKLPEGKVIEIQIKHPEKGVYDFMCDMGMYQGKLVVK